MRTGIARVGSLLAVSLATVLSARGQMELDLRLEHPVTLQYEAVVAFVSIANTGFDPLDIGGPESNALDIAFLIKALDANDILDRITTERMAQRLIIQPERQQDVMVDLSRHYNMSTMGRYMIAATLTVKGRRYESRKLMVEIVKGIVLTSSTQMLPDDPERRRTYTLRYWAREGRESLFLSADETNPTVNFGLIHLGHIVRVMAPTLSVDRKGTITITHQSTADIFTRSVLQSNSRGIHLVDQTLHLRNGAPYVPRDMQRTNAVPQAISAPPGKERTK